MFLYADVSKKRTNKTHKKNDIFLFATSAGKYWVRLILFNRKYFGPQNRSMNIRFH